MRPDQSSAERTSEARGPGAPPDGAVPSPELTLVAAADAPATARAAVTAWMARRVSEAMLADAQLIASELVANSVRHAAAAPEAVITLRADVRDDVLRLEVADRGNVGPIARRPPDFEHGGGFGLHLVEVLSMRWGVSRDDGTLVWAELRERAQPRAAAQRQSPGVVQARMHTARRRAVVVCEAATRAQDGARRARGRRAALLEQIARGSGDPLGGSALPRASPTA